MGSDSSSSYTVSFVDLMNQTPPFCTQTPSFSTQIPSFSTQTPSSTGEARRRWTVAEDGALVSAWLNTSKDCVVGNEQRAGAFWKRVTNYYSGCPAVKDFPPREWNTCKQRWTKINEGVQKFCGCFEQASRNATSGQSEDDVFQMAYKYYYQDQRTNFILEHAWRMLRNDQKWCSLSLSKEKGKTQSKRAQPDDSVDVSPIDEQVEERPIGVKAAKAAKLKGSKNVKRTSEDREAAMNNLQLVAALREKEFALKEKAHAFKDKLADKKLLAHLLGKTEPLTDIEITLKDKLISQIL